MAVKHIAFQGITGSGKTVMAKRLSTATKTANREVLVYDPLASAEGQNVDGWAGHVFTDWDRFHRTFWASRGCLVFIDEAGDVFADHKDQARPMLTRGRHVDPKTGGGGHTVALISQRWYQLDKTARNQISVLFGFRSNIDDAIELSRQFACDDLKDLAQLPLLHYMNAEGTTLKKGLITF